MRSLLFIAARFESDSDLTPVALFLHLLVFNIVVLIWC